MKQFVRIAYYWFWYFIMNGDKVDLRCNNA